MTRYLFFLFILLPVCIYAQEDESRYIIPNSVPVEDGKIVFTKNIKVDLPKDKIMLLWSEEQFINNKNKQSRILLTDKEKGQIICQGLEYIEFKHTTLLLDRAKIKYRLLIDCFEGECKLKFKKISYKYDKFDNDKFVPAEEYITDEYALNRKKTKLSSLFGKFRVKTIDRADELFEDADNSLKETKNE